MNFNKIITSVTLLAASIFISAQAQQLPEVHQKISDDILTETINSESFIDQAFNNARHNTPFEAVMNADPNASLDLALAGKVVNYAEKFLGTRYVWGATGPSSFDCSGFTSYVYRNFGINLNRTSSMQYTQGQRIRQIRDMQPGDLLFFSSRRSGPGNVGHVAMVVSVDRENNSCTFIHASTKRGVVYQSFPDNGYYSSHYIGAKRILGSLEMAEN